MLRVDHIKLTKSFMLTMALVCTSSPAPAGIDETITAVKNGNYSLAFNSIIEPIKGVVSDGTRALEKGTCKAIVATMPPMERGIAVFEALLGDVYYMGHGVPKDYAAAVKWYHRAAEKGNALSQSTLGDIYYYGYGVPQNYVEAAKWWQAAANQGAHVAQLNLSVMFANGNGVPVDLVKSHMYANLAAGGLPPGKDRDTAASNRDYVATLMKPEQVVEAQRRAAQWEPSTSKGAVLTQKVVKDQPDPRVKPSGGAEKTAMAEQEKIICRW